MRFRDGTGTSIALGIELGRGGEGAVHEVQGDQGSVAKIYHKPPDRALAEKLQVMTDLANDRLARIAAWPRSTIRDERGNTVGFTMPRVAGLRPVFQVYGPKLRLRHYPKADWRFLVHAAANTARAFEVIAAEGHVVGDVNHGNLLVSPEATTRFIDADSFQISRGGRTWPCTVGVGTHQPPEMQGMASYANVVRTANHDAFGLAVIVFQILCMGRHPFMGRYLGAGEPPDIPAAIAQSRYAHGRDQRRTQMAPGLGSLPISVLPDEIQTMFEAAFSPGATGGGRPDAATWTAALQRLGAGLATCRANPSHAYPAKAGACPWCTVEAITGAPLFPIVFIPGREGAGMALLWQQVQSIRPPPALPALREPDATGVSPSPAIIAERRARTLGRALTIVAAGTGLGAVVAFMPPSGKILPLMAILGSSSWFWRRPKPVAAVDAADRLREAREDWRALDVEWRAYRGPERFGAVRRLLDGLKAEHDGTAEERKARLAEMMSNRRSSQLRQHLERYDLADMRIPGIGKGRVTTLISYGICTAGDITPERIEAIPGFGPKTIVNMVAARDALKRSFRFDERRALGQSELATLDQEMARKRLGIEGKVGAELSKLKAMAAESARLAADLEARAARLKRELGQALADARA